MNRDFPENGELHNLVARLCNEDLDAAGHARLNELLTNDRAAQQWYVRYVDLHASVRHKMQSLEDDDFALLEVQAALNTISPANAEPAESSAHEVDSIALSPTGVAAWARTVITGAAAAALLVGSVALMTKFSPEDIQEAALDSADPANPQEEWLGPAMLSGVVGARWAGASLEFPEGQIFDSDQRLELIEGLAELTFRGGARIIVQGPAVLEILGDSSADMSVGRVAVDTGVDAEFVVQTAAGRLTSRDGEFGADVDVDGSLVTEVYHGQVELHSRPGAAAATTFPLAGGQGVRVDGATHRVTPLAKPYELVFVRYLPKHELLVNLADVVAGGNGVRKAYHRGVSLVTGGAVDDYGAPAQGNGQYIRSRTIEFVDGVFIPNGKLGPVQVDSIGRKFAGFPPTAGDSWGQAIMARRPREEKSLPFIRLEYHGDNYGYVNWLHIASKADELSPDGYGLIGMHSNSGITFDLHAVRAKHPTKKIVRFRARVGNLESKPERFVADAWVIVDGEERYRRREFSREDGPATIDVPLSDRDRFLVLAVTDVGENTAYDWVAFGDPLIELAGVDEAAAEPDLLSVAPSRTSQPLHDETAWRPRKLAHRRAASNARLALAAMSQMTQLAGRLFSWQLVGSLWNHLERTDLHDMTSIASLTL